MNFKTALLFSFIYSVFVAQNTPPVAWEVNVNNNIVTGESSIQLMKTADASNREGFNGLLFLFNPSKRAENGRPGLDACVFAVDKRIDTTTNRIADGIYQANFTLKLGDDLSDRTGNVLLKTNNMLYPNSIVCHLILISLNKGEDVGAVIPMATGGSAQLIFKSADFAEDYTNLN